MTTIEDLEASKDAEEIYLERARFLLNTEDILEQILEQILEDKLEDNDNIMYNSIYQENNINIDTNVPLIFV